MASFGEKLRRSRESKSITLEEIAEATKIGIRYLRALEENDFDPLPGGVFDRGFVRAYAQAVGLDADATVEAYLAERGKEPRDPPEDQMIDALHKAADRSGGGATATIPRLSFPAPLRAGLVVAGIVIVVSLSAWGVVGLIRGGGESQPPPRPPATAPATAPTSRSVEAMTLPAEPEAEPEAKPEAHQQEPETRAVEPRVVAPPAAPPAETQARIRARIVLDRPVKGSLNCDNRRIEMLDGLPAGAVLELNCQRFLLLNVPDGGAVRVGLNGKPPTALVADGQRLDRYGIYP